MPRSQTIIGIVTAALFAAVAVWTGSAIAKNCVDVFQLRNAVVVKTRILDIEREIDTSGDGRKEVVFVTYAYEFEGNRFESRTSRLTLFGDSSFLHRSLEKALSNDESVRCYLSRTNPSLSVFSLHFSVPLFLISLVFPLAFGAVSIIILKSLLQSWKRQANT